MSPSIAKKKFKNLWPPVRLKILDNFFPSDPHKIEVLLFRCAYSNQIVEHLILHNKKKWHLDVLFSWFFREKCQFGTAYIRENELFHFLSYNSKCNLVVIIWIEHGWVYKQSSLWHVHAINATYEYNTGKYFHLIYSLCVFAVVILTYFAKME